MNQMFNCSGKRIIITGASSGIGREVSILCSKLGAEITMIARNEERLCQTMDVLEGTGHKYYLYDFCNVNGIEDMIKMLVKENGPYDGFVHSAGVDYMRPLRTLKPAILNELMTINYYSFVEMVRCLTMRGFYQSGMSIVAVSSISSQRGSKTKTAYCASKAAIDASVRCMAKELADKDIRVNSVLPCLIDTDLYRRIMEISGESEEMALLKTRQYAGVGNPLDVAGVIAFLLSGCSKQITGANIDVSGGFLST